MPEVDELVCWRLAGADRIHLGAQKSEEGVSPEVKLVKAHGFIIYPKCFVYFVNIGIASTRHVAVTLLASYKGRREGELTQQLI